MEAFKKLGLDDYFNNAYGYALFETVGKGAFIVGVGGAKGEAYTRGEDGEMCQVGKVVMTMASGGWSLGVAVFSEIIFFENETAFQHFCTGNFEFSGTAQFCVLTAGAATSTAARYTDGTATFMAPKGGLFVDVSAEGQKFFYEAL
jgi:lipid-binding SYLF domain-containing protein